jgi:hypothetical protein
MILLQQETVNTSSTTAQFQHSTAQRSNTVVRLLGLLSQEDIIQGNIEVGIGDRVLDLIWGVQGGGEEERRGKPILCYSSGQRGGTRLWLEGPQFAALCIVAALITITGGSWQ